MRVDIFFFIAAFLRTGFFILAVAFLGVRTAAVETPLPAEIGAEASVVLGGAMAATPSMRRPNMDASGFFMHEMYLCLEARARSESRGGYAGLGCER